MKTKALTALVAASTLFAAPVLAQESSPSRSDIETAAAAFVQPSNAERLRVITEQLTAAGVAHEIQTFEGGNDRTGPMVGKNVVVTMGRGDKDIVLTAHYDAVKLRDGTLSQGVVDNVGSVMAMMEAAKTLEALRGLGEAQETLEAMAAGEAALEGAR